MNTKIKKGDYVQVIAGDEVGKRGRVLRVMPETNKVIVEGINYIYRHMRKSQKHPQGGRIQKEAPLDISNVMLYCQHCQSLTRACYRFEEKAEGQGQGQVEGQEAEAKAKKASRTKVRCCTCEKHLKI